MSIEGKDFVILSGGLEIPQYYHESCMGTVSILIGSSTFSPEIRAELEDKYHDHILFVKPIDNPFDSMRIEEHISPPLLKELIPMNRHERKKQESIERKNRKRKR